MGQSIVLYRSMNSYIIFENHLTNMTHIKHMTISRHDMPSAWQGHGNHGRSGNLTFLFPGLECQGKSVFS